MKKVRILILSIICVSILAGIAILIVNENYNINQSKIDKKAQEEKMQEEQSLEAVSLKIDIKQETDESYKCLLTFTANSEDNKIKSIEYPAEEGKEPQIIQVSDENGREEIGIDYEFSKDKVDKSFVITTIGEVKETKKTGYKVIYNPNNGNQTEQKEILKCLEAVKELPKKDKEVFLGWSENENDIKGEYFRTYSYQNKEEVKLYGIWLKVNNESILGAIETIGKVDNFKMAINEEIYSINLITKDGDLVLDGTTQVNGATLNANVYEFGDKDKDVATEAEYAKNMVVLKVNGNLNINENITLTSCKSDNGYGGPKGMLIYCGGTITNNGTISMTARGAKAEGQDVYLWKNADNTYEYVPAMGAIGAPTRSSGSTGIKGSNGVNRQTGGGGSGGLIRIDYNKPGAGAMGTSYSGGTGGGRIKAYWIIWRKFWWFWSNKWWHRRLWRK